MSQKASKPGALVFACLFCVAVHFFLLVNACFCCVRFSFFHTKPTDWPGENMSEMTFVIIALYKSTFTIPYCDASWQNNNDYIN